MHVAALACLLVLTPSAALAAQESISSQPLRFWLDEYAFTPGETTLLREEIEAAGPDVAVVSGETKRLHFAVKGYDATSSWDIYWTGRQVVTTTCHGCTRNQSDNPGNFLACLQACERALTKVQDHQRVSCVPGIASLARKNRLIATLVQHYGEGAFELTPRSWLLPNQYWQWRVQAEAQGLCLYISECERHLLSALFVAAKPVLVEVQKGGKNQLWVLKQDVHRGKGVHVMKESEAINEARLFDWHEEHKYVLVQQYMNNQLQVKDRRFYIRLWVLVTSITPLKVYLFDGGVVIFGSVNKKKTAFDLPADDEEYIVNLWTQDRESSQPISMAAFQQHINAESGTNTTFDTMWAHMQTIIGYTYAAGLNSLRYSTAMLGAPAGSSFEVFGVDMLVDTDYRPWLVEVNAVPSLARKVVDCADASAKECHKAEHAANAFDTEKVALMHGLFKMLQAPPGQDDGQHGNMLEDHIRELKIAAENRFLPILMVPEAVQYAQQQKRMNAQLRQKRKHQPGVIRAAVPSSDRISQRELLSLDNAAQNASSVVTQRQAARRPSVVKIMYYTCADMLLHVWYWLPTKQEVLLWLSQYVPVADVLCMDYFRLVLGNRTPNAVVDDIPLHPLDQALHDVWLHRQQ